MYCKICGFKLSEEAVFCPNCGTQTNTKEVALEDDEKTEILMEKQPENDEKKIQEQVAETESALEDSKEVFLNPNQPNSIRYCPNCGTVNNLEDIFCIECGTKFGEDNKKRSKFLNNKKKLPYSIILRTVVIILICILAILVLKTKFITGRESNHNHLFYIKDNALFSALPGKYKPLEIDDDIFKDEDNSLYGGYTYSVDARISKDGKYIYYEKNISDTYDLYRKNIKKKNSQEEKIDSDIIQYTLLDDNKIIYIKDSNDQKLYIADNSDKEKIGSDVLKYYLSEDKNEILWWTTDDNIYSQKLDMKSEKTKLSSDVNSLLAVSSDLNNIVFGKERELYICKKKKEIEKVSSDVISASIGNINDDVVIYYQKDNGEDDDLSVMDFVNDNYANQDKSMTEPNVEDYQRTELVEDFWGTREKIVTDDSYYDEMDKYDAKLNRDWFREYLVNSSDVIYSDELYLYKNGESKFLNDIVREDSQEVNSDESIITDMYSDNASYYKYQTVNLENIEKMDFSEAYDIYEQSNNIGISDVVQSENYQIHLLVGDQDRLIQFDEMNQVQSCLVDYVKNKNLFYFTFDIKDGDKTGKELYSFDPSSKEGKLELVSDELEFIQATTDNNIYYTENADEDGLTSDLYKNGDLIDSDYYNGSLLISDDEKILYIIDADDEGSGALCINYGKESKKIADDVAAYMICDDDNVAYLTDYNYNKFYGDLNIYKNNKNKKVDTDVSCLIYRF